MVQDFVSSLSISDVEDGAPVPLMRGGESPADGNADAENSDNASSAAESNADKSRNVVRDIEAPGSLLFDNEQSDCERDFESESEWTSSRSHQQPRPEPWPRA